MRLTSAATTESGALLGLEIFGDESPATLWRIAARNVREHRFKLGSCHLSLKDSHPLLWQHQDAETSLFISSKPANAWATIGKLWSRHQRETEGWLDPERFLNPMVNLHALLDGGAGLLARGPERLLRAYAEELDSEEVRWSIAGTLEAKKWRPGSEDSSLGPWIADGPLSVLLAGKTYVVAATFEASQIAPPRSN